jgi:curved DNA-binding protein CbpA
MNIDPYAILNIDEDATPDEIQTAYRKLANEIHPDKHQNDRRSNVLMAQLTDARDAALRDYEMHHPQARPSQGKTGNKTSGQEETFHEASGNRNRQSSQTGRNNQNGNQNRSSKSGISERARMESDPDFIQWKSTYYTNPSGENAIVWGFGRLSKQYAAIQRMLNRGEYIKAAYILSEENKELKKKPQYYFLMAQCLLNGKRWKLENYRAAVYRDNIRQAANYTDYLLELHPGDKTFTEFRSYLDNEAIRTENYLWTYSFRNWSHQGFISSDKRQNFIIDMTLHGSSGWRASACLSFPYGKEYFLALLYYESAIRGKNYAESDFRKAADYMSSALSGDPHNPELLILNKKIRAGLGDKTISAEAQTSVDEFKKEAASEQTSSAAITGGGNKMIGFSGWNSGGNAVKYGIAAAVIIAAVGGIVFLMKNRNASKTAAETAAASVAAEATPTPTPEPSYDSNVLFTTTLDGHRYLFCEGDADNVGSAAYRCSKRKSGAHLAEIGYQEENDALYDAMVANGLHNAYFDMSYNTDSKKWSVQSDSGASGYSNWADGYPVFNDGQYWYNAELSDSSPDKKWINGSMQNDDADNKAYVCEIDYDH